ncbi:hypothetical protein K435DRAFT_848183 [Dendrothele bispora CBS 962.96]|uniref:BHLH domain-containing protein n=1 Tax=Dendrothele bispora (strain CBS 962.96) TaxID=1314807 RepID=A0A4S8MVD4_DENBC|nr:hypothetical protein K435DRAFT_848183 [Dendrothele bispora CBS 962.96]
MSNLLTPSESHAVQSFLSAMDYPDSNDMRNDSSEWPSYTGGAPTYVSDIPQVQQGREALAKATKDLMSLDAEDWNSASMMQQYPHQQYANFMPQQPSQYGYDMHNHPQSRTNPAHQQHQQHQRSHRNASFPFLSKQRPPHAAPPLTSSQSSPPPRSMHAQVHVSQSDSISSLHPLTHLAAQDPRGGSSLQYASMGSPPVTSSSTTNTYSYGGNSNLSSPPLPATVQRASGSPGASCGKRGPDSGSSFTPNKRSRPSPPSTSAAASVTNKATLLSPSQKKANHIQSEQKRRANIRRGYEALCETVPALREAIRLEEEAQNNRETGKVSKSKRGRRGKIDETTGEKIDGRAGPRSENIVLGKTIDYINDLLKDREALLERLERARSTIGPNHPSYSPSDPQPLWEREWKGGSGKDGDGDDEDEEDY